MASFLTFMFSLCLGAARKPEQNEDPTDDNIVTDELYFVIPQKDYERFMQVKPNDKYLSIGQFMFLFYYLCDEKDCQRKGLDYENVEYTMNDAGRIFALKGWIPTKGYDKVTKKIGVSRTKHESFQSVPSVPMVATRKYHVDTKSWSRHLDQDNAFIGQRNNSFTGQHTSSFHLPPLNKNTSLVARCDIDLIQNDADDYFEVEPIPKRNNRYNVRPIGSNTMYRSTREMKVRHKRPKAARGPRTQPNSMIQY